MLLIDELMFIFANFINESHLKKEQPKDDEENSDLVNGYHSDI